MDVLIRLISMLAITALFVFWLWMFRDMMNNDSLPDRVKYNWTLMFVFANLFAAVYYYVYQYRTRH